MSKEEVSQKVKELSNREVDFLIGKYFYRLEVKISKVKSKNSNNIKYVYLSNKKNKSRHFSKNKSELEKTNDNYRPLPRWSTDIRDCYNLVKDANKKFGEFRINFLDENKVHVLALNEEFTGKLCDAAARLVLFLIILEDEK